MIYLGTSGFSYKDWVGPFYPQGMPVRDWLLYYSQEFNCCEINSTYYAIPTSKNIEAMASREFVNLSARPQCLKCGERDLKEV